MGADGRDFRAELGSELGHLRRVLVLRFPWLYAFEDLQLPIPPHRLCNIRELVDEPCMAADYGGVAAEDHDFAVSWLDALQDGRAVLLRVDSGSDVDRMVFAILTYQNRKWDATYPPKQFTHNT